MKIIQLKLALLTVLLAFAYIAQAQPEPIVRWFSLPETFNHAAAGHESFSESSGHSIYEPGSWGAKSHSTFLDGISQRAVHDFARTQHIAPSYDHLSPEKINSKFKVNGNSKSSTNIQHGYVIVDKRTGDILKYGVSGGSLNKNGTSPRANKQVNAINKQGRYVVQAKVLKNNVYGREKILNWERGKVEAYKRRTGRNPLLNTRPQIGIRKS